MATDDDRALSQRKANAAAKVSGEALPFPNVWDMLDPTKVPPESSAEQILESQRRFSELCRPRPRKRHAL